MGPPRGVESLPACVGVPMCQVVRLRPPRSVKRIPGSYGCQTQRKHRAEEHDDGALLNKEKFEQSAPVSAYFLDFHGHRHTEIGHSV